VKPDGILSNRLAFAPDYLSPEMENLAPRYTSRWRSVFNHIVSFPNLNILHRLCANSRPPAVLVERAPSAADRNPVRDAGLYQYRLTNDRIPQVLKALEELPPRGSTMTKAPLLVFTTSFTGSAHSIHRSRESRRKRDKFPGLDGEHRRSDPHRRLAASRAITGGISCRDGTAVSSDGMRGGHRSRVPGFLRLSYYRLSRSSRPDARHGHGNWVATTPLGATNRRSLPLLHGGIAVVLSAVYSRLTISRGKRIKIFRPDRGGLSILRRQSERCGVRSTGRQQPVTFSADPVIRESRVILQRGPGRLVPGALLTGVWMLPTLGITETMIRSCC